VSGACSAGATALKRHPLFIMLGCLVVVLLLSLSLGQQPINLLQIDELQLKILLELRLPRVVVALLMGAALGVAGAILQGVFRNSLADPYVLGTSSGAALAAAFGLLASQGSATWLVPCLALVGALVTSGVVVALGRDAWGVRAERLLLSGVGIGFFSVRHPDAGDVVGPGRWGQAGPALDGWGPGWRRLVAGAGGSGIDAARFCAGFVTTAGAECPGPGRRGGLWLGAGARA